MSGFPNNNPYAPPEPVEEDAPSYDLRKIAGLYNRLGIWRSRFVELFVVEIILLILLALRIPTVNYSNGISPFESVIISGYCLHNHSRPLCRWFVLLV